MAARDLIHAVPNAPMTLPRVITVSFAGVMLITGVVSTVAGLDYFAVLMWAGIGLVVLDCAVLVHVLLRVPDRHERADGGRGEC